MPESPPVPSSSSSDATPSAGLFRRPAVLIGLGAYLAALGALAWALSASGPPPLEERNFPRGADFEDVWVARAYPHLCPKLLATARVRFRTRVDELGFLAELYEAQKCWGKAARCYEEIAVLVPSEKHAVNRYVRSRAASLARMEE